MTMDAVIFHSISPLIFLPVKYCSPYIGYWYKLCPEIQIYTQKRVDPQLVSEFALANITQLTVHRMKLLELELLYQWKS